MDLPLVLAVAISMVFLYLLGSQGVLSMYELWAGYTNSRGKFLYRQLKGTIGVATAQALYNQPPIASLSPADQPTPEAQTQPGPQAPPGLASGPVRAWWRGAASALKARLGIDSGSAWAWWLGADGLPAYIPADLFAATLLAMVAPGAATKGDVATALATAGGSTTTPTWLSGEILTLLDTILASLSTTATVEECQKTVARWFDAYGERLTGWYKRRTRGWLFLLGLVVAVGGNIDSPYIIRYLWAHPELSQHTADAATLLVATTPPQEAGSALAPPFTSPAAGPPAKPASASPPAPAGAPTKSLAAGDSSLNRASSPADSLTQALRLTKEQVAAFIARSRELGFPIGRAGLLSQDSTSRELPDTFYIKQPARATHKAGVLERVPAYYTRYTRQTDSVASQTITGAFIRRIKWSKVNLLTLSSKALVSPHDRSNPQVPFFGPQPQLWWHTLAGWLLTAAALSVGAPFWFDLLCRLVNIRNLGIKPPRTAQESA